MTKRGRLHYARPILFFFGTRFVYTFDEVTGKWLKYPDWEYLNDALDTIRQGGNRYWLKSQRMLITISFCLEHLWEFLFTDGVNIVWIGKNERSVDNGGAFSDWNSAFGKMRMMYDRLPGWLKEMCLGRDYHSKWLWKFKRIKNPRNDNVIMGQSPTPDSGVGEGFTRATVDEAASVAYLKTIHTNLSQSCKENRDYISFPLGRNNFFANLHFTENHFTFEKIEIPHYLNPNYNDQWLKRQRELMTDYELAQRIFMSFEESAYGKVWDEFDHANIVKETEYIKEIDILLWWDFGFQDATSVGLCQLVGDKLRIFDWYEVNHSKYQIVGAELRELLRGYGVDFLKENDYYRADRTLSGYGDPQVKQTEISSGSNLQEYYKGEGFPIQACGFHQNIAVYSETNKWLKEKRIQIDPKAEAIIDSMRYWEWPKDAKGNPKLGATQPRHDQHSHAGKAWEYGFFSCCVEGMQGGYSNVLDMYKGSDNRLIEEAY